MDNFGFVQQLAEQTDREIMAIGRGRNEISLIEKINQETNRLDERIKNLNTLKEILERNPDFVKIHHLINSLNI